MKVCDRCCLSWINDLKSAFLFKQICENNRFICPWFRLEVSSVAGIDIKYKRCFLLCLLSRIYNVLVRISPLPICLEGACLAQPLLSFPVGISNLYYEFPLTHVNVFILPPQFQLGQRIKGQMVCLSIHPDWMIFI